MFNLESSISAWRQQMLAAGIQSPVPLEELEAHLREDIARRIQAGSSEQQAFATAAAQIGHARDLGAEFRQATGWSGWFVSHKNHILAALWLAYCVDGFCRLIAPLVRSFIAIFHHIHVEFNWVFAMLVMLIFLYLGGAIASIQFFINGQRGRRFLRFLAFLDASIGLVAMAFGHYTRLTPPFVVFGLISLWLLRPLPKDQITAR